MIRSFHRLIKIEANARGDLPTTIELLRVGSWKTPWHGEFEITADDIQEFVRNANAGIGLVAADKKIPINYGHASYDKAAAWIPKLYASEDGQALLGDPEWTPAARKALAEGEWKYISPEFNPRDFPWEDPEQEYSFVNNVLTGAALTNIPLFKKLKPVMASIVTGDSGKRKQGEDMDLEKLRVKKLEDLTEEEKTYLTEHKDKLTEDERKTFGLEQTDDDAAAKAEADRKAKEEADAKAAAEEAARKEASRKGQVSISADRLAKLEADAKAGVEAAQKLAHKEASDFVSDHIKAGRIKSGEKDATVKMLLAASGEQRTALEDFIKGLPVSKVLASEAGSGSQDDDTPNVSDEESALAASFGNTPEEIAEFKKKQGKSN